MAALVLSGGAPALAARAGGAAVVAPRFAAATAAGPIVGARASEPVVLTGSQVPSWSRAAVAVASIPPQPYGISSQFGGDNARSAHHGTLTVPPDARAGIDPDQVAAYRWDGANWTEVPVQVDQRYPYLLANGHSSFSFYSGTSREITYAWNPTAHSTGEEAWKKVFGGITGITNPTFQDPNPCVARYQLPGASGLVELAQAKTNKVVSPPTFPGVPPDDYTGPMPSPADTVDLNGNLHAHLTDDDEIAMMARDAGLQVPQGTPPPPGTSNGQTVTIIDPTSGTSGDASAQTSYIYLFLQPGGSSFNSTNGYVQMTRDNGADTPANDQPNADTWIDRYTFAPSNTEKIGASNTGYGPNVGGDVCRTSAGNDASPHITIPDGQPRLSSDRGPRDGMTITTPTYRVSASGRWMVRQYGITSLGTTGTYGPNLISRWKGRAFQSSPDSSISVVGFEDEQVNWELNAALLGWKAGPVRAIRETWGADSGTNVTKTEVYYRDADVYHYHVRVHPIPPDGLYTAWDYRLGLVSTYYNLKVPAGVPIDGTNTANVGEVNQVPVTGQPAFFNACDPATQICTAILNPEEIAGPYGGMVYISEIVGPTSAGQPAVVPYYRDDACFDDGTGDGPPPRPWPKNASTDSVVEQGYVDYWHARGMPVTGVLATDYAQLKCQPAKYGDPATPAWQQTPFTGAIGQNGLHYFFTSSTDQNINEIDAQQWRFAVPMTQPTNVTQPYGQNVQAKLQSAVNPYGTANPAVQSAVSTSQYTLANSDGSSWQEIDATKLRVTASPSANQSTLLSANADLFTANSGFNQDLGIFVSDNGGADQLLAWKESGGFAGTYSPNAAYAQHLYAMTAGHSYVFKLKWKTNVNAPNSTIYAGAGPGGGPTWSPTSLVAKTYLPGAAPNFAVSNSQFTLADSDGSTWQAIDAANLSTTLSPTGIGTAVVGANADLWTSQAGYNQDLGIFVSDNGGADSLVAWKESGGFAGTYSPNAAFVKATYPVTGGHTYAFKLKWKTNKNAPGATIWAAAGGPGNFSPTSLLAETVPLANNLYDAASTSQYVLTGSDGATWQPISASLDLTVQPTISTNSILGANADLFTDTAGYNQDIGIFASDNGAADTLVAWKESGGFAGTLSPNAAFAQMTYQMQAGHTYVFKLKWKTNKSDTSTIFAGAGSGGGPNSPTRLTVELVN